MLKIKLFVFLFLLHLLKVVAQPPQAINYQGIARDSMGHPLLQQNVGIRLSILDSSAIGSALYVETHHITTNNSGLFNLSIGSGNVVAGTFANIPWAQGSKWLKIEMDASGGNNYLMIGTTQFLSVPYALNAANGNFNKTGNNIYNSNTGSVGIGTSAPASSAILDASSTTKGFLPPRMTRTQRDAIVNPVAGLVVWCSNCAASGELEVYNGTFWTNMVGNTSSGLAIGQSYQGGILAYILQPGDPGYDPNVSHGIIAAPADQSTGIQWFNGSYITTFATGTAIGTGNSNTSMIVAIQGAGSYAAKLCYDLVINGYSDWYLPSKDELHKLYLNQTAIGGFASNYYWSSSEADIFEAWYQSFLDGHQSYDAKSYSFYVRAIRAY